MNKMYNVYFDPNIEDDDIVACGIDDFKCGDRLCLINLWHITSGVVKSQIPETPDKPSGLYVGARLSLELGIDIDPSGDIINVFDIDVMKIITPGITSDEWLNQIPPEITTDEWKNMYKYLSSIN